MTANSNKFPDDAYFFPAVGESSRLLVGCRREDYSASRIARAVEDCDAHLLNLNVTNMGDVAHDPDSDEACDFAWPVVFDIRVTHRNATGIARSLERYGYSVLSTSNDTGDEGDSTSRERIDNLMRYLEI